jgi:Glycosyl transferase family 11
MIIIKLTGGLGNQMFHYAAGYAEAKRRKTPLKLDLSAYKKSKRPFVLDHFAITAPVASASGILLMKYMFTRSYMEGDFQSERYFKDDTQDIRRQFALQEPIAHKYPEIIKDIQSSDAVAVHVRRGDYLDKEHRYIILGAEYYAEAMKIITEKVTYPKYFFFSDDIEWVKQNLAYPQDSVFLCHADYEDLILMSMCKHQIIANSTFSWWAAWLNQNKNKVVIAPQRWFTNTYSQSDDLVPHTWIRI